MIYTRRTKMALRFMEMAHRGQVDRGGVPYAFHPYTVAEWAGHTESETLVALLHDITEDTEYTLDQLRDTVGLTEAECRSLKLLAREKGTPYMDYIRALKGDPVARKVKIADLRHNMNIERLENPTERDMGRIRKYGRALSELLKK